MKPNIVLAVFDTARASAFEPWGAPAGATPTITQLASRGVAVEHAVSTCNWTLPSHAAMFTGALPRAVGLCAVPNNEPKAVRPVLDANRPRLVPEVLRRAGYTTRGASANAWIGTTQGFDTGFDTWVDIRGNRDTGTDKVSIRQQLRWLYEALKADLDDGAAATLELARNWLDPASKAPFFWFFNLIECHSPYLPPKPYNDLGPIQRLRATREARRHLTLEAIWRSTAKGEPTPAEALGRMRHLYERAVTSMDVWLANLLTLLDERGVLDDTWIIVTSDHGENLGEGGLLGHAFSLDQRLIHVPLVIAGPDRPDIGSLFSTLGVAELIGKMAGLAANPWTRLRTGRDDVAVAQYEAVVPPGDPRLDIVTKEWDLDDAGRDIFIKPMTVATDGTRKLVRHGPSFELFDLASDPGEERPTSIEDPASSPASDLYAAMVDADAGDLDPEILARLTAGTEGGIDDDLAAQLRLLGYL